MGIFNWLFGSKKPLAQLKAILKDEDEGYSDHLVGQKEGPFYCGTIFCGHSTKKAARQCWADKLAAIKRIADERDALFAQGKFAEGQRLEAAEMGRLYPESNPDNWPCNRSSREMQRETLEKWAKE